MADAVTTQWVYPPNWDETEPDSPFTGIRKYVVKLTNVSDGGGESSVIKVNISRLRLPNGDTAVRTVIDKIKYTLNGMAVKLEWDRAAPALIAYLQAGSDSVSDGCLDFWKEGGLVDPSDVGDRTGDILLTTVGHAAGDSYDITISFRPKGPKNG
jgi:hypothetical protein